MKLLIRILLIAVLTYLLSIYLPWWILMVVSFIVGFLIHGSGVSTFVSGFLGAGLVWISYAAILDYQSNSDFTQKMIELFPVDNGIYLLIISGAIGGICGGLAAASGNSFKYLFVKKQAKSIYH
ncbi:hypothetical protein [Marinoscillum sp. MHG1-6]|uniref:hypothetical protein n=1 Tax=Marinoscillum sp. MHG1-6 TaxID=2959627 RepID=UPI002157F6CC|nr:hypothetical protein [Marinoscillum sp. MHG1-6]